MKNLSTPIFVIIFFFNLIFVAQSFAQTNDTAPLYSFENMEMDFIPSKQYRIDEEAKFGVFPIPIDNAIGVNSLGRERLSYLTFGKNKLSNPTIKEGFEGADRYFLSDCITPIFSKDWIAWGQLGRFFLYNLKTRKHKYYSIGAFEGRWEYIKGIWPLDSNKLHFLFLIQSSVEGNMPRLEYYLQHISFDKNKVKGSKLFYLEIGEEPFWRIEAVHGKTIFMNNMLNEMHAFNLDFEEIEHPLVDLLNKNNDKDQNGFRFLEIHPILPFALTVGENKLWLMEWEKDIRKSIPIINRPEYGAWPYFSPDGKWLLVNYGQESEKIKNTVIIEYTPYLIPIKDDFPHYLGKPVKLESYNESFYDFGENIWSTNPLGFNVIFFDRLIHWQIEDKKKQLNRKKN